MRIAFFSQGPAARHVALVAAHALDLRDRGEMNIATCAREAITRFEGSSGGERDDLAALPLEALSEVRLRRACDLAVVVAGPSVASFREAVAACHEDLACDYRGAPPHWLLLSDAIGLGASRPKLPRILPLRLPALPRAQLTRLSSPSLPPDLMQIAARTGACLALAASDPFATQLSPSRLKDAFSGRTADDLELRARLLDLAAKLDDRTSTSRLVSVEFRSGSIRDRRRNPDRGTHVRRPALTLPRFAFA